MKSNSNTTLTSQEKLEERESWYKLVVKVILWNEQSSSSSNKITRSEWIKYRQQIIKTDVTHTKERVLSNLENIFQKIKLHGGLEE